MPTAVLLTLVIVISLVAVSACAVVIVEALAMGNGNRGHELGNGRTASSAAEGDGRSPLFRRCTSPRSRRSASR